MTSTETATSATTEETKKNIFNRVSDRIDRFNEEHPVATVAMCGALAVATIAPAAIYINNKVEEYFADSKAAIEESISN